MCDIDPLLLAKIEKENRRRAKKLGLASVAVGIFANSETLSSAYTLLKYPPGSTIDPFQIHTSLCIWAVLAPLLVLPLAVSSILIGRRWWLGILGVTLGLTPIFAPGLVFQYIVAARHLVIESSSR